MLQLRTQDGKPYVGDVEVETKPIYLGMSITVDLPENYQGLPPLETVLTELFSDKYKEGVDLFEANAYRHFTWVEGLSPEINGTVPASMTRLFVFDFYKVEPRPGEQLSDPASN